MHERSDAHVGVYQVLDGVLASTAVPPGTSGAIFSIVDQLRTSSAAVEDVRRAEQVSIEIYRLESALRRSDCPAPQLARDELRSLAADWLQTRISGRQ